MAKKAAPKKAAASAADKSTKPKAPTKGELYSAVAEKTGLTKKEVAGVIDALTEQIKGSLGKKGTGLFVIPGVCKMKVVRKPATKAKQVANPFKPGEMMTVKAKPARNVVKIVPLKALKESV